MSDEKKEYSAEEVAKAILDKAKELAKSEMEKASPENTSTAKLQNIQVPGQQKSPEANMKVIAKQPLQLKKFMEKREMKKNQSLKDQSKEFKRVQEKVSKDPKFKQHNDNINADSLKQTVVPEKFRDKKKGN